MVILDMICVCSGCPQLILGLIVLSAVAGFLLWKGAGSELICSMGAGRLLVYIPNSDKPKIIPN